MGNRAPWEWHPSSISLMTLIFAFSLEQSVLVSKYRYLISKKRVCVCEIGRKVGFFSLYASFQDSFEKDETRTQTQTNKLFV